MSKQRFSALFLLLTLASVVVLAACGATTGSGAVSSPSAAGSAEASAPASGDASAPASESAAPSESAEASASAGAGGDLSALIPAQVGDVQLSVTVTDGEAYVRANVNRQLAPILTVLNKAPTDVTVATATGSATGGATLFIDAVQVTGTDAQALLDAFSTAAAAVPGATVETVDVGGKSVVKSTTTSYTLAAYASGDTLFYIQSPDAALVDQAIAALP